MRRREFIRLGALGALGTPLKPPSSAILVWLSGGLSQLDTFDMKPEAPREIRGEFRPIATTVAGLRICEHLPRLARRAHRLTLVRSLCAGETNHERAAATLVPAAGGEVHGEFRPIATTVPGLARRAAATLVPAAGGDVALYGDTPLGRSCLAARRAVESGARFALAASRRLAFDTHAANFNRLKDELLPELDRALSALLDDLAVRGLLDTTLVVAMGEFGRSPRINPLGGRDHHAGAWSAVLAGGGLTGGRVIGATDRTGSEVVDAPLSPAELVAAITAPGRLREMLA